MRSLTVLQIIPALGTGGAEQACVDVAAALAARGDTSLVASSGGRRVHEIEQAGARHILCEAATKNPLQIIRNALWLEKVIKAHNIDIVHARSRAPAWTAYIACKRAGCHFVTTFHAAYKYKSWLKRAYNKVMTYGERCIAISPFIADYMRNSYNLGDEKIRLINRGIDVSAFDSSVVDPQRQQILRQTWGVDEGRFLILLPARLSPIKNHSLVIEAMSILKAEGKDLPLVCFVGDDQGRFAYTETLQSMIRKAELEGAIKLVGPCADMPAAFALASLVLMPSKVPEGFGRVPVEAMAMGIPVIASNLGATQFTVLNGETGWLLPPDAPALWARQIEAVMHMSQAEKAKITSRAREYVQNNFTTESMATQTLAVYDEVVRESL